jgi:hypothetical protein
MTNRAVQRHLAIHDLDLDAASIETDIVGQAFTQLAGDIGIRKAVTRRLAHFGNVVLRFDVVQPTPSSRSNSPWRNGLPASERPAPPHLPIR